MTLQEYIYTLPNDKQFRLALRLTKLSLRIWENYADKNNLTYRDSVVGLVHSVDRHLPANTITAVERSLLSKRYDTELLDLRKQFDDPIVALQDMDWELPKEVQKTFYSVFNLLEAYMGKVETTFGELTTYVSINQAAEALEMSKNFIF